VPQKGQVQLPPIAAEIESGPGVYVYEIRGRRDPFRSLLVRKQVERTGITGIAGMLVDELELQGTVKTRQGWIAMMRGADNKSYLVKKSTTLFDGEVTDIGPNQVTFRQNVNDPTNPKPFRDVVKSLSLQQKP
jgi:Tfp pilus assembly protein PilP